MKPVFRADLDEIVRKLEWAENGEWSVPLKPEEAKLLLQHIGHKQTDPRLACTSCPRLGRRDAIGAPPDYGRSSS